MSEFSTCPRTGEGCKTAMYCSPANRPLLGVIPLFLERVPGSTRNSVITQISRALNEEGDALHAELSPCEFGDNIRVCPVGVVFGPLGKEHGEEVVSEALETITVEAIGEATSRLTHMADIRELNRANRA